MLPPTLGDGGSAGPRATAPAQTGWVLLVLGLLMAVTALAVLARAWSTKDPVSGWAGVLLLVGGIGVAAPGAARLRPRSAAQPPGLTSRSPFPPEAVTRADGLPRLGEILLYKYHLITERDLERALERQQQGIPRPLGEVLVEMGKITWRDLAKALQDQLGSGVSYKG
jgi:hypothetical protein